MPALSPRDALHALRTWTASSADQLAAAASVLVDRLQLQPAPETTASPRLTVRTIRYYTSEGVVSPPEGKTRRVAYGYRHLLELLWVKEAQARGLSLEDIRRELDAHRARGEADLEAAILRRLPDPAPNPLPASRKELGMAILRSFHQRIKRGSRSEGFSAAVTQADEAVASYYEPLSGAADLSAYLPFSVTGRTAALPSETAAREATVPAAASLYVQLELGEGLRLLVPAEHPLVDELVSSGMTVDHLRRILLSLDAPEPAMPAETPDAKESKEND